MFIDRVWALVNLTGKRPAVSYRIGGSNATAAMTLGAQHLDMTAHEARTMGWRAKKVEIHLPDKVDTKTRYVAFVTRSAAKALPGLPGERDNASYSSRFGNMVYIIVASRRDVVGREFYAYEVDENNPPSEALLKAVQENVK